MRPLKQLVSVVLCACLLLTGPGAGALLAGSLAFKVQEKGDIDTQSDVDPEEAFKFFEAHGTFSGPDDPMRTYLGDEKRLTPIGENLYRYLKAQPNPKEEILGMMDTFKALAKTGPYNEKKASAANEAVKRYEEKFGDLPPPEAGANGSNEDTFRLGAMREAYMTGAAVSDPPKQDFTQVQLAGDQGWEFWDKEGVAYRLNKNKVTVYNRELQKNQREMNKTRPPQAPMIPETGRYNSQMIELSYWKLQNQYVELEKAYHIDRMLNMAELLGKQYKDDMWFKDLTLEKDLERWARAKTYNHNGKTYSVYDIVDRKTSVRRSYLEGAAKGIDFFKGELAKLKTADTITDAKLSSMQLSEQYVLRYLSMIFLESQKFYVKNQRERLDPRSPDSDMLAKAIKDSPMDAETRAKYKAEGDKLRTRLDRLMLIFGRVEDTLVKADYASSLDSVQAALNSSQKELGEVNLDYSLFAEVPSVAMMTKMQTGSWVPTQGLAIKLFSAIGFSAGHSERVGELGRKQPVYDKITRQIANGDYWLARKEIIAMNPDANLERKDLALSGAARVTDPLRVSASLKSSRTTLTKVADYNKWVETVGNFAGWTISLALAAPLMSGVLTGVSRMAGAMNLRLIEECALQAATRLNSLSPAAENLKAQRTFARYLEASAYRGASAGMRQGGFTALSGVISGGFTAVGHYMDNAPFELNLGLVKIGDGHSSFKDDYGWDAFLMGMTGGVHWANESFHPALGYIGLPSSYFEETRLAGITQTIGQHGVVGTVSSGVQAMASRVGLERTEQFIAKMSLQNLASKGWAGKSGAFVMGMADNVSKYGVFSQGVGWVANGVSWHSNFQEKDVERRIKSAQKAGLHWMESPAWLLIPVFPAKYEEAASGHQNSMQGAAEYEAAGRRAELTKVPESGTLPRLNKPTTPITQILFNASFGKAKASDTQFTVTKEMQRKAISAEIMETVPGGGKDVKPGDINPMEFLRISQLEPKETPTFGRLDVTENVKLQGREKFGEALLGNQRLTEEVLAAKPGTTVKGFGEVTPGIQREVAVEMHVAGLKGEKVGPTAAKASEKLLRRYLDADSMLSPAEKMLEAVRKNTGESPAEAMHFKEALDEIVVKTMDWKRDFELSKTDQKYPELLKEFGARADALKQAGKLTEKQHGVLKGMIEYVTAMEGRFNAFNNVEMTHVLVAEELGALKIRYANNNTVTEALGTFAAKLKSWYEATPEAARKTTAVEAPGQRAFKDIMEGFKDQIKDLSKSGKVSAGDLKALEAAQKEMAASPWILHDTKGTALSSWRPGQFESLMISLAMVAEQGKGGAPIREFIRLTTGGGKTLMTFEGLLPLAEADAKFHRMEVRFLTVQSNLEAQARLEFLALKKIGSKLKFDTYEGFKSEIAEAKSKGKKIVEKVWILGDEMDGAALQPALTLGETTGHITRVNSVYNRMEQINAHLENVLGKNATELGEAVKMEARRGQSMLDALNTKSPEGAAARLATEGLLKAAERLGEARTAEANLQARQAVARELGALRSAIESPALSQSPEALASLFQHGKDLQAAADALAAGDAGAQGRIRGSLKEQSRVLDASGLGSGAQGQAFRRSINELYTKMSKGGEPVDLAAAARETAEAQKALLNSTARLEQGPKERLGAAALRIKDLLAQEPGPTKVSRGAMVKELAEGLQQQANLLPLVEGRYESRVESLRIEARSVRQAAESRLASLRNRITAAENEAVQAQAAKKPVVAEKAKARKLSLEKMLERETLVAEADIKLAQRFEAEHYSRAQRLIERTYELREELPGAKTDQVKTKLEALDKEFAQLEGALTPGEKSKLEGYRQNVEKLYKLGKEMAALDELIVGALKEGKSVDGMKAGLEGLSAEAHVVRAELVRARREALASQAKGSTDLAAIRSEFRKSGQEILETLKKSGPGSEAEALRLLEKRKALLEAFAGSENPLYEVYRTMKKDAYSIANSSVWNREQPAPVKDAGAQSKALVARHLLEIEASLGEVKATASGNEPPGVKRLREKTESMLAKQADALRRQVERSASDETASVYLKEATALVEKQAVERHALSMDLAQARPSLGSAAGPLDAALGRTTGRASSLSTDLGALSAKLHNSKLTEQGALEAYGRKIDGVGFWRLAASMDLPKLFWTEILGKPTFLGKTVSVPVDRVGLTRLYSARLIKEVLADPIMPPGQRDRLFWTLVPSLLNPKGVTGKGSGYVRTEFINMVRGYSDNPATIRMDNLSGRINVVHNGQWFDSMDNPTRRFWELEYGTDLTLPYTHKSLSTIKDITANKNARFISLSATAGKKYQAHLSESGVPLGGKGAAAPENVGVDVVMGEAAKFTRLGEAVAQLAFVSKKFISIRPGEILSGKSGAPPEVKTYLETTGIAKKDGLTLEIAKLPEGPVRNYFTELRTAQGSTGLVVISLPDTKILKQVRRYLLKTGKVLEKEIAQVFSDSEWLRTNRPEAKVHEQMNLDAMRTGEVKVLLLDTRVGGRGLDLDYKGSKADTSPKGFKGYTNYEMMIVDPHEMSAVHLLQAQGRIDLGRVLLGAQRDFHLVMDVKSVQKETLFKEMFHDHELFVSLRNDPAVLEFARAETQRLGKPVPVDWPLVDAYIKNVERSRLGALSGDAGVLEFAVQQGRQVDAGLIRDYVQTRIKSAQAGGLKEDLAWVTQHGLIERYERTVKGTLDKKQELVEEDQLRSSSVLQEKARADPRTRWLDLLAR